MDEPGRLRAREFTRRFMGPHLAECSVDQLQTMHDETSDQLFLYERDEAEITAWVAIQFELEGLNWEREQGES